MRVARTWWLLLLGCWLSWPAAGALTARELAVIINDDDPDSLTLGSYYAQARAVPPENVIHVTLGVPRANLDPDRFIKAWLKVRLHAPPGIEAYALAWTFPYRVDCMSITSAFAVGFDQAYCAKVCQPTAASPYYDATEGRPWEDYHLHLVMQLAARTPDTGRNLVNRGVRSDGRRSQGRAYLVTTRDPARNTRSHWYPAVRETFSSRLPVKLLETDTPRDLREVMFFFTGAMRVSALDSFEFLPGAVADHLTSYGGQHDSRTQMPALDWLEAGATASYGTVVEPCNYPQKFPVPGILMSAYLNGDTVIEAYWKSVPWPGQGLFIGEPLAKPYSSLPERQSDHRP